MVEMRRARTGMTTLLGACALLVLLSAGSAQANECREARGSCMEEAEETTHVCRQDCQADVQDAIDAARSVCDDQSLEDEACRVLVHDSVKAVARECRSECRDLREDARRSCRVATRECFQTVIDPLDDVCVDSCREQFAPCRDEQALCHDECREGAEAAVEDCHNAGLDFRATLQCMHEARKGTASCVVSCHDTNACHGGLRECLRECPAEGELP
jgi:hypothetical protein